ncbi:sulfotransferase [Kordiimonas gwangyangensis]|uniref:sulfotransferase n=1 Tax=Kordiimonas gwangyangensis TaxID=288022 RepID=UPI000372D621|nr:sulfotransferase [Kordiimonas gwangyangensis]
MSDSIEIDGWNDRLGGFIERYPGMATWLGKMESRVMRDELDQIGIDRPIYIAGVARAGSTILLEMLARHDETVSHRYRDFPLVQAPVVWSWFVDRAGRKDDVARERAHKDRIKVTPESPEAFEEILWMQFFPHVHQIGRSAVMDAGLQADAFEAYYRDHIRKILHLRGGRRYLAKGNYNSTRLPYLRHLFAGARFLVPVRHPDWHVASLMKQHRLFMDAADKDPRITDHLRRSGHYEFGPSRRAIDLGDGKAEEIHHLWQKGQEAEGYALYWASVYGHIADQLEADAELKAATGIVRYEDMCKAPDATMAAVLDHVGLSHGTIPDEARETVSAPEYYEPEFTADERAAIKRQTANVAAQFGYG